jgi:hypothetical protein
MRGPSYQDCEKSFARTGVPSENLKARKASGPRAQVQLIQIQGVPPASRPSMSNVAENASLSA